MPHRLRRRAPILHATCFGMFEAADFADLLEALRQEIADDAVSISIIEFTDADIAVAPAESYDLGRAFANFMNDAPEIHCFLTTSDANRFIIDLFAAPALAAGGKIVICETLDEAWKKSGADLLD